MSLSVSISVLFVESQNIYVKPFEIYCKVLFSHLVDTGGECVETLQERIDREEQ